LSPLPTRRLLAPLIGSRSGERSDEGVGASTPSSPSPTGRHPSAERPPPSTWRPRKASEPQGGTRIRRTTAVAARRGGRNQALAAPRGSSSRSPPAPLLGESESESGAALRWGDRAGIRFGRGAGNRQTGGTCVGRAPT
jgi:hypothetical protein